MNKYNGFAVFIVCFAVLFGLFANEAESARKYMVCTGDGVRMRSQPNTKANIINKYNKGNYLMVDGSKNTGEEFPWYRIVEEDFYSDEFVEAGWMYGQFLRDIQRKSDADVNYPALNGIPWGTPFDNIQGLKKLENPGKIINNPNAPKWKFSSTVVTTYNEKGISIPNAHVTYMFDSQKKLVGMYLYASWAKTNKNLVNVTNVLEKRLGETTDIDRNSELDTFRYSFNGYNIAYGDVVDSGWTWGKNEFAFFYSVYKK